MTSRVGRRWQTTREKPCDVGGTALRIKVHLESQAQGRDVEWPGASNHIPGGVRPAVDVGKSGGVARSYQKDPRAFFFDKTLSASPKPSRPFSFPYHSLDSAWQPHPSRRRAFRRRWTRRRQSMTSGSRAGLAETGPRPALIIATRHRQAIRARVARAM